MEKSKDIYLMPILVDSTDAAKLCGVCRRYWTQLDSAGKVPMPIRLGKRKLWAVSELEKWVAQGCPSRGGKK